MKISISFIFILLSIINLNCAYFKNQEKAEELLSNCKKLEVGMNQYEISKIMGTPIRTTILDNSIEYCYLSPWIAAEQTCVDVDSINRQVVEIHCGENYRK